MTLMDKEDKAINNKKTTKHPKKKKKQHLLLYKLISFILVVLSVGTISYVIYNEVFTFYYMIPIIIVVAIILFVICFILNKERLRSWIKNIFAFFAILIMVFDVLMLLYGTQTLKFISNLTDTGYRVETFGVYVLDNSTYTSLNDLENKTIYYLDHEDDTNIRKALSKVEEEVTVENDYSETLEQLLNSLESSETDAILVETSYESVMEDEFESIYQDLRLIDTIDIVGMVETIKSDVDITKDPFIVYISGIDTKGNVASKARSDVNILLAVNPETHEVLLVNTPRDYYVTLASKGKKDKLTHAGLYGIEESINTLNELYGIDINYYARVNFTSFVKIVDALDGIKVNVTLNFCEQDSNRSFASGDLICLNKGTQTLNGEQALAYARHRKTIGDRKRGENQMLILEAIINKALSPKILTNYSELLAALDGKVTTNMTANEIYKFSKRQLSKSPTWNFQTISVTGEDSRMPTYSLGSAKSSVIIPDNESVAKASKALSNLLNGVEPIIESDEETTTAS